MKKYVKIVDNLKKTCLVGTGKDIEYYKHQGYAQEEVEQSELDGNWYLVGYAPMKTDEQKAQERQKEFNNNFIITSWGAFRKTPQGYSSAVEAVNTIFNMVNIAQGLTESLAPLLIFYEVPDFTDPKQCTEDWLVANQKTHEPCDLATFMQWYLEFQTIWAQTQYTSQQVPLNL